MLSSSVSVEANAASVEAKVDLDADGEVRIIVVRGNTDDSWLWFDL